MRLSLFLIFFLFPVQRFEAQIQKITIDPEKDSEAIFRLSDFASGIRYVRLETKPESMIDFIKKIQLDSDLVFILSHTNPVSDLLVFTESGRFLRKIGKHGRGPGEYSSITDFTLDRENRLIYLMDTMGTLFVYRYTGECLRTEKIQFRPTGILFLNKHLIYFQCWPTYSLNGGFAVTISDPQHKEPDIKLLNRKYIKVNTSTRGIVYELNYSFVQNKLNSVSLLEGRFDTLYNISADGKAIPKYVIDLRNNFPKDMYLTQDNMADFLKYSSYSLIIESDNFIFLRVGHNKEFFLYIIDKESGSLLKQNTNKLTQHINNDLDGGLSFTPRGLADSNVIFAVQSTVKLKQKLEKPGSGVIRKPEMNAFLRDLVKDAEETDNPVIAFAILNP